MFFSRASRDATVGVSSFCVVQVLKLRDLTFRLAGCAFGLVGLGLAQAIDHLQASKRLFLRPLWHRSSLGKLRMWAAQAAPWAKRSVTGRRGPFGGS